MDPDTRDVTFIIPFRAKDTCRNWDLTSGACVGTIRSLLNQRRRTWRCILVCHDVPDGLPDDDRISVRQVDLPIPSDTKGFKLDKGLKIKAGIEAYSLQPTYFYMVLDADDLVSSRLAEFLATSDASRVIVSNGYVYNGGPVVRHHRTTFDRLCGSVVISNVDDLSTGLVPIMHGHHRVRSVYRDRGLQFQFLPFPGTVKNVSYGGNLTKTSLVFGGSFRRSVRKALMLRPLTRDIKLGFGIDSPG